MVSAAPIPRELPARATWQLTHADRCDACGSRALFRATLLSGGILLFCRHHGLKHAYALQGKLSEWLDETGQLNADLTRPEA